MKKQLLPILISVVGMNLALAQPIVTISGSDDSLAHLTQIMQCLNYLDVRETIYLQVQFSENMPEHLEGITWVHPSPASDGSLFIKVRIDAALNTMTQRLVLAHEMIHVKQYVKGELSVIDGQHAVWKGKTYDYQRLAHRVTPWEREAFRMHQQLAQVAKEPSQLPLTASRTGANQP